MNGASRTWIQLSINRMGRIILSMMVRHINTS